MAMLGERVLPESVNAQRRKIRNRLQSLREPVRRRREDLVPGPDIIGSLESRVSQVGDKVVTRDGVVGNLTERVPTPGSGSGGGSSGSGSTNNTSGSNNNSKKEL